MSPAKGQGGRPRIPGPDAHQRRLIRQVKRVTAAEHAAIAKAKLATAQAWLQAVEGVPVPVLARELGISDQAIRARIKSATKLVEETDSAHGSER